MSNNSTSPTTNVSWIYITLKETYYILPKEDIGFIVGIIGFCITIFGILFTIYVY